MRVRSSREGQLPEGRCAFDRRYSIFADVVLIPVRSHIISLKFAVDRVEEEVPLCVYPVACTAVNNRSRYTQLQSHIQDTSALLSLLARDRCQVEFVVNYYVIKRLGGRMDLELHEREACGMKLIWQIILQKREVIM